MSAEPTPQDVEWLNRHRGRRGATGTRDRDPHRAATTQGDILDLVAAERQLDEVKDSLIEDVEILPDLIRASAWRTARWERHHKSWAKRLDAMKIKSNEDIRAAFAMAYPADDEQNTPGEDLYLAHVEAKADLDAVRTAVTVKATIVSALQTLIKQASRASGLPD